jgi:monoterpene epsilon-lactone hydrolase
MSESTGRAKVRDLFRLIEVEGLDLDQLRAAYDSLVRHAPLPADAEVTAVDAGGVPSTIVRAPGVGDACTIVWFHSGGYMVGSTRAYEPFAYALSVVASAQVLLVDYRLAPENPFPAAIDDAVTAATWALTANLGGSVVIGGDSAGGGLCLATLVKLRDAGLTPVAAVALSPVTDLAGQGDSMKTNGAGIDYACTPATVQGMAVTYFPGGDPTDPRVSPVYDDLAGLPPVYVTAGSIEALLDDSTRVVEKIVESGGEAALEIGDDLGHIWPIFPTVLPEAVETLERIGKFVRDHAATA